MSSEHTPGPWVIDASYPSVNIVGKGATVCEVFTRGGNDRHLIAAAPDLLALLEDLIDIEGPQPGHVEWARRVRVAIAKAKGP